MEDQSYKTAINIRTRGIELTDQHKGTLGRLRGWLIALAIVSAFLAMIALWVLVMILSEPSLNGIQLSLAIIAGGAVLIFSSFTVYSIILSGKCRFVVIYPEINTFEALLHKFHALIRGVAISFLVVVLGMLFFVVSIFSF